MIKTTISLCLVLALGVTARPDPKEEIRLGQAEIAIPTNAPEPVAFAAEELKTHLDKITGTEHRIVHVIPQGPAIVLGDGPAIREIGVDVNQIKRDGYVIKTVGDKIYIAGKDDSGPKADIKAKLAAIEASEPSGVRRLGSPEKWLFHRGTLYGVYRFLEELGVRWYFPGPKGTIIPEKPNLRVAAVNLAEAPRFETREVGGSLGCWNTRSGSDEIKALALTPMANALWKIRQRWSSFLLPMNHRPPRASWVERFGKTRPEYFALLKDGKRDFSLTDSSHHPHLCYGSPEVARQTLVDIDAFAKGKPATDIGIPKARAACYPDNNGYDPDICLNNYVSLTPNDSFRRCYCPLCEKYYDDSQAARVGPKSASYPGSNSKYVWRFIDKVARVLKEQDPNLNIVCLAYSSYSEPYPGMEKLPDNVIVGHCPAYMSNPYLPLKPEMFKKLKGQLAEWATKTSRPMDFWAHHLLRNRRPQFYGVPVHAPQATADYLKLIGEYCDWVFIELDFDSVMFEAFNRYLMTRLLWDPTLDPNASLAEFTSSYFGPQAGPIVKSIYDDIGTRFAGIYRENAGQIEIWGKYFPEDVLSGYRKKVDEALALTKAAPYGERVELFSRYYLGLMEKGYAKFNKDIRQMMARKDARGAVAFTREPVSIDGKLDDPAWDLAPSVSLGNNRDGKPTQFETRVRLVSDKNNLYAAFVCQDYLHLNPSLDEDKADSVELFFDPNHDHNGYYQIIVDKAGRITNLFFEGDGERGQSAWNSDVKVAIQQHQDHWVVEVAVPRKSMEGADYKIGEPKIWGANFCRTQMKPREGHEQDRYSRWSPFLFGAFNQPDLFGHLTVP